MGRPKAAEGSEADLPEATKLRGSDRRDRRGHLLRHRGDRRRRPVEISRDKRFPLRFPEVAASAAVPVLGGWVPAQILARAAQLSICATSYGDARGLDGAASICAQPPGAARGDLCHPQHSTNSVATSRTLTEVLPALLEALFWLWGR